MIHICQHKFKDNKDGKRICDIGEGPDYLNDNYRIITELMKAAQYDPFKYMLELR